MQVTHTLDIALVGIPGLLIGLMIGYLVGGMSSLRVVDRIGLGIAISGIGGLILSLVISLFIPITNNRDDIHHSSLCRRLWSRSISQLETTNQIWP